MRGYWVLRCRAEEKLRAMRATFGANACHLVRINSSSGPEGRVGYEGMWRSHVRRTLPGGGAGEPAARPPVPPQVTLNIR